MRPLVLLLAVSVPLLFFDFGARVFSTNDEARFPMLARDILARGDWLLPRLDGSLYLNKPPLHAWLIALASWPGGTVTQGSAALPSLVAALGVVAATFWIGRRLFGAQVGLAAGLVVVTTYGLFTLARVPVPDLTLCALFTAAIAAYVAAEFDGRRAAQVTFFALVGLAFWAKGPAGLLPIVVVVLYALVTHGWSGPTRLASTPGLLLLVLLVAPWGWLSATAGGERFLRGVVVTDWLGWYVPTRGGGWRTLTEPLSQTLAILLPWSLLLPFAVWSAVRTTDPARAQGLRLLLLWAGAVFIFIAVSPQQRMRYYLPLCPPGALLIAAWYSGLRLRRPAAVFAGLWLLVAAGLGIWHTNVRVRHDAATDLGAMSREIRRAPAPLYALDAPNLAFSFYLEEPVLPLPSPRDAERRLAEGRANYLIVSDRALAAWQNGPPLRRVSDGLLGGRRFALLASP